MKKDKSFKAKQYHKPEAKKWLDYNTHVTQKLRENGITYTSFCEALKEAAEKCLDAVNPEIKKPYITKNTWEK